MIAFLVEAKEDGVISRDCYTTSNRETYIFFKGEKKLVEDIRMDGYIVIRQNRVFCAELRNVRKGDFVVASEIGVIEIKEDKKHGDNFEFMSSLVSFERDAMIDAGKVASYMHQLRLEGRKIAIVAGPAVVHAGGRKYLAKLVAKGYVNLLLSGNALATHDIEADIYGTSLGKNIKTGEYVHHSNHLWAINKVNANGGIKKSVEKGIIKSGIMYECIKHNVEYILSASLRDDGPLKDVISDMTIAQEKTRNALKSIDFVLMLASMLHSIAVGNMLPQRTKVVCVDINSSVITKLSDRGTTHTIGIVTDVGLFLRALWHQINKLDRHAKKDEPL